MIHSDLHFIVGLLDGLSQIDDQVIVDLILVGADGGFLVPKLHYFDLVSLCVDRARRTFDSVRLLVLVATGSSFEGLGTALLMVNISWLLDFGVTAALLLSELRASWRLDLIEVNRVALGFGGSLALHTVAL